MGSVEAHPVLITVFFGTWVVALNFLAFLYIANVVANRELFEVRVRIPSLTIVSVFILQHSITSLALREIFAVWGGSLPHQFQDFAMTAWILMVLSIVPYRLVQILLVFDSSLRTSYYKHFRKIKPIFLTWTIVLFVAFFVPLCLGWKACITM